MRMQDRVDGVIREKDAVRGSIAGGSELRADVVILDDPDQMFPARRLGQYDEDFHRPAMAWMAARARSTSLSWLK